MKTLFPLPCAIFTQDGYAFDAFEDSLTEAGAAWLRAFRENRNLAFYRLGLDALPTEGDPAFLYLQRVSSAFFGALMRQSDLEVARESVALRDIDDDVRALCESVPFVIGSQWVNESWIAARFQELIRVFSQEISEFQGTVAFYFAEKSQNLRVPERIFFHLVENRNDEEYPFAFMATYASADERGRVQHHPLKYALTEYASQRERLMGLLACLNRVSEISELIAGFIDSGELFHALRLTAEEAYTFLKQIEAIEACGVLCRMPNWWKRRASRPTIGLQVGEEKPSKVGLDALIQVQPQLLVDGVPLTQEDIRQMLAGSEGLRLIKGKWVEVNHDRLRKLLQKIESMPGQISLLEAMRGDTAEQADSQDPDDRARMTNGQWLNAFLNNLRRPERAEALAVPESFRAQLRPYQLTGYRWLYTMHELGFGACLADDMGLGKTVQVLGFLEKLREEKPEARVLLVVPASLIGNWEKEKEKFAPLMPLQILHGRTAPTLEKELSLSAAFLTLTSYGMAARLEGLKEIPWDAIVLDEAQAIKNAATRQAKAIKALASHSRFALTGTPIENDLSNLWSLYDFLDQGLLGTAAEFKRFVGALQHRPAGYTQLKGTISPFLLRRLKTDQRIIQDLPEKQEIIDHAALSRKQVLLYRSVTQELERTLGNADGIQRKGLVLATILKLKQICNHPDQYLGQTEFSEKDSGKLEMLRGICETIRDKRERVLVFTQFREMTEPLAAFLEDVFDRKGLVLHGGVPVKKRQALVDAFQGDDYLPFMVLSVRAGGTGLNLTKANHVIHFDRWWNPAVENQATDRAFRIGQTKDVMVHKFVCMGTVEEKIDEMITEKKALAEDVIGAGGEKWITELSDGELMNLLKLEVK